MERRHSSDDPMMEEGKHCSASGDLGLLWSTICHTSCLFGKQVLVVVPHTSFSRDGIVDVKVTMQNLTLR